MFPKNFLTLNRHIPSLHTLVASALFMICLSVKIQTFFRLQLIIVYQVIAHQKSAHHTP